MEKFDFLGKKFERNLSFHETAKIFGTSNVRLLELLRKEKILFRQDKRNLPFSKYVTERWFEVTDVKVENDGFLGIVPLVRVTRIGLENIANLIYKNPEFINGHNNKTFWSVLKLKLVDKVKSLGIKNVEQWLILNTITYQDNRNVNEYLIYTYIQDKKVKLISYDTDKKTILEHNER